MSDQTRTRTTRLRAALAVAAVTGLGATALTVLPAAAAGEAVTVQYRQSATGSDQVEPWLKVVNTGTTGVPLSQVKVRYYFKADAGASYTYACSWAVKGCANITGTFGTLANPTATADRYLEVGFTAGPARSPPARTPATCNCASTAPTGSR